MKASITTHPQNSQFMGKSFWRLDYRDHRTAAYLAGAWQEGFAPAYTRDTAGHIHFHEPKTP